MSRYWRRSGWTWFVAVIASWAGRSAMAAPTGTSSVSVNAVISELSEELQTLTQTKELTIQAQPALPFQRVLNSVDRAYPELLRMQQMVREATGKRLAASGIFDPKISFDVKDTPAGFYDTNRLDATLEQLLPVWGAVAYGGYRRASGNLPIYYLEDETLDAGELRAGLRIPLLQGGPIDDKRAKLERAEWELLISEADRNGARLAFFRLAARHYWDWVANYEKYRVQRELLRLAELRDNQIQALVDRGAAPAIERLENLRAILNRREAVIKAHRSVEKATFKLSLFLRDQSGQPMRPAPGQAAGLLDDRSRPPVPLTSGIERALRRRPEIIRADHEVERTRVTLALASNRQLPELGLTLEGSKDLGFGTADQEKSLAPTVMKLGLKLTAPIFFRAGRGETAAARAKLEGARLKARFARDKVEAEVRDAQSRLHAVRMAARTNRLGVRAAKAVAGAERRRFELGSTSLLIVNLREQAAASAEVKWLEAKRDVKVAGFEWDIVTMAENALPAPDS